MSSELFGVNTFGHLGGMDPLFERDPQPGLTPEKINEQQSLMPFVKFQYTDFQKTNHLTTMQPCILPYKVPATVLRGITLALNKAV